MAETKTIRTTFGLPGSIRIGEPKDDNEMWELQTHRSRAQHARMVIDHLQEGWTVTGLGLLVENGKERVWFSEAVKDG